MITTPTSLALETLQLTREAQIKNLQAVDPKDTQIGCSACPLCERYRIGGGQYPRVEVQCSGCPVDTHTDWCKTPMPELRGSWWLLRRWRELRTPEAHQKWVARCEKEIAFLKQHLPKLTADIRAGNPQ